jgi:tRNA modification GTPase
VPSTNTIVALATPPGRSGIGVIRLSGSLALEIARTLTLDEKFSPQPNHVVLKNLSDPETGEVLDSALITYFKSPHSFTGEDVIELSCHGSPVLLRYLLDVILRLDARVADPGEYTLRALSNGRLNLSQAEAIRDLIDAQTDAASRQAARQLRGELSAYLQPLKQSLLEIIVPLESALEFVEDNLPPLAKDGITNKLTNLSQRVEQLASTFRAGRLLKTGLKVTLAGRPNVGKSSVFNALLNSDRAIVSELPGTTRDSLSELVSFHGVPVLLTDTAGVRSSSDKIENLGVERTRRAMAEADIIVIVLDGSEPLTAEDRTIIASLRDSPCLIVFNKSDLQAFDNQDLSNLNKAASNFLRLSAKTGSGLQDLRTAVVNTFAFNELQESDLVITDARHFDLLQRSNLALLTSIDLFSQSASEELVLVGLYDTLRLLGQITGETTPDEVLSQIFSTFCIGK